MKKIFYFNFCSNFYFKINIIFLIFLIFKCVNLKNINDSKSHDITNNRSNNVLNDNNNHTHEFIPVDFKRVGKPIIISLWIFMVCIVITGFNKK